MSFKKYKKLDLNGLDSLLISGQIRDFMAKPPITLPRTAKMREAKELMRQNRISGIPVVDKNECLRGIISIEDIINALEHDQIEETVGKHMEKNVEWLLDDTDVPTAMQFFTKYDYGRYPVINRDIKVVGVVTQGDLINYIYRRIGGIYLHNKIRDEKLHHRKRIKSNGLQIRNKSFTYSIDLPDLDLAGEGSTLFKRFLNDNGFPDDATRRASIALYEAEVNVVIHAGGKGVIKAYLDNNQVYILVKDIGPGIDDIELAVQPGYTTASDEIRERGFGAGMGLDNIKRFTDKLIILSSSSGVKMEMVIIAKTSDVKKK